VLGSDQALVLEHAQRIPHGHAGNVVVLHELCLGRDLLNLPETPTGDQA
jgi:hypothetical protein